MTESEVHQHNSLYYLFENQSQVKGINKPVAGQYYNYGANNMTNTFANNSNMQYMLNMTGNNSIINRMLDITHMTKNTGRGGNKSQMKMHQGPPSQSRIINLEDL